MPRTIVTADPATPERAGTVHVTIDGAPAILPVIEAERAVAALSYAIANPVDSLLRDEVTVGIGWLMFRTNNLDEARRLLDDLWTMTEVAATPPRPLTFVGKEPA